MFRTLTIAFFFAIISLSIKAQSPTSFHVPIVSSLIEKESIDIHPLGDSVLLSYEDWTDNGVFKRAYWVMPNGKFKLVDINAQVISVNRYEGDTYFYVIEQKGKKSYLKAIVDRSDKSRFLPTEEFFIEGDIVDSFVDKNQFFILHNRETRKLVEIELNRTTIVSSRSWDVPGRIDQLISEIGLGLVQEGSFYNSFLGAMKVKLYRSKSGQYRMTLDERVPKTLLNASDCKRFTGTYVLNLGDTTAYQFIPFRKNGRFGTWLSDGKLFRYSTSTYLATHEVFDLTSGDSLAGLEIDHQDLTKLEVYERKGHKRPITQKEIPIKLITYYSSISEPLIVATRTEEGKYLIMNGSNLIDNANGVHAKRVVLAGLTGIIILGPTIRRNDSRTTNRYYYSVFDPVSRQLEILPKDAAKGLRDKVDRYEMIKGNVPKQSKVFGYAETSNYVVGYYYDKLNKVQLAWFSKQ